MFFRATALTSAELISALNRHPLTVSPETNVLEAIDRMSGHCSAAIKSEVLGRESHHSTQVQSVQRIQSLELTQPVSCVVVVENERVVGILTERDVVRLLAQRLPLDRLVMRQVMIHPVITINQSIFTDLTFTVGLFQQHQIRHLPILDDHDRLVGVLTYEAALIASKKRFRQLVENTLEGVWVIDAEDRTSYVNPRTAEMLGYHVFEMMGRSVFDFMDQAASRIAVTDIERRKNGIVETHDCRFKTKTGQDLWTLISTNPLYDEAGTYTGAFIMLTDISDRKQTEARLRESEQRYASLTQASPIGIFRADKTGHCSYVNERWCQITGINFETAIGQGWQQCLHPDDRQRVIDQWYKSVQDNQPCQLEYRLQRPDGTIVWVYTKSAAEADDNGAVISYIGTVIDISDRKRSEEALRNSEAHQRALISAMPDLIMRINRDGIYLEFIATSNFRMFGKPIDLVGTHIADTFPPELVQKRMEAIYRALDTRSIQIYEQTIHFDDHEQTEEVRIVPYSEDEVLTLIRDVSDRAALEAERQQAEAALRESEARWQFALEGSGDGVWDWDLSTHTLFYSPRWKEMLGYDDRDIGDSLGEWSDRIHSDDRRRVIAATAQLLQGEVQQYVQEYRFRHKDGSYKWILDRGKVVEWTAEGKPSRVIGTHTDISDRKQIELALAESERSLSTLISNLPGYIYRVQNNPDYTPEFISSGVTAITGYELAEYLIERSISCGQEMYPDDATRVWDIVQRAVNLHQAYECEYRIKTKSGEEKWLWERGRGVYSEQNELLCLEGFVTEITDRKRAESQLQNLIEGTAATTGQDFFPALAKHIAVALDVSYALVSEQIGDTLRALAFWADGALQPTFSFPSLQTPCERTLQDGRFYCPDCVQQQFPSDHDLVNMAAESYLGIALHDSQGEVIGSLCILDKQMIRDPQRAENLLRVFAARASAELERERATRALEQLNHDLETKVVERTAALQASEEQFQTFMSHSPTVAFIKDEAGRLIYVNRVCEDLFGMPQTELQGKTCFDFLPPEIAQPLHENDCQIMTSGQAVELIETVPNSLGHLRDWLVLKFPLPQANGGCWLGGVGIDITDRQQTEQENRILKERLQFLLASSPAAIYSRKLYGSCELTSVSQNVETILGYSPAAFTVPSFWSDRIHPDDAFSVLTVLPTLFEQGSYRHEYRFLHEKGHYVWIRDELRIVRDQAGTPIEMIGYWADISDLKQAEMALRESEARFRRIYESRILGMLFADFQGNITAANDSFLDMIGYSQADLEAGVINWASLTPPEYLATDRAAMEYLAQHKILPPFEKEYYRQDGSRVSVLLGAALLPDASDQTICLVVDISDRKRAELALQESQRFIQQIADASPNLLYLYDLQEKLTVYANRDLTSLGYSAAAAETMKADFPQQVLHPDDRQRRAIYHRQLSNAQDNEILEFEYRLQQANGEWRWFYSRDAVFNRDEQGQVRQIIGTAQDISDRKNAELALQTKTEELDRFFSLALDLLCFAHTDGHFIRLNSQWEKTLGYPLSELEGSPFIEYVHPDDRESTLQTVAQLQEGEEVINFVNRYRCRDGSYRWLEWRATPKDQLIYAAARDITDRQQAEAELQHTNEELARATRLKDEFLANMSHELRTPLNAVLGMTEVLLEQAFGDLNERQIKALKTVERSGSHLLELINDILDVAKIESGQITLEFMATAVEPLCKSSLSFIKQQALKKRIQIETELPEQLPKLFVDERRIRQVLINLLNNAVKFTPEGGRIKLTVTYLGGGETASDRPWLRIAISDTGIGIAPENIHKLFRPFVQIDSALNRRYQGTGLGLALVKRLVDLHGGEVGVISELGRGSCFTVDLPCAEVSTSILGTQLGLEMHPIAFSAADSSNHSSNHFSTDSSTAPLILLAEDNESNTIMISNYLESKGYRVRLAKDGQEAVKLTRLEPPNLILMDIQMPGMSGLEATEQIRREPNFSHIPIIALTALAMTGDRERCLAAGADEYLSKPVKLKQLAAMIQQFLAQD